MKKFFDKTTWLKISTLVLACLLITCIVLGTAAQRTLVVEPILIEDDYGNGMVIPPEVAGQGVSLVSETPSPSNNTVTVKAVIYDHFGEVLSGSDITGVRLSWTASWAAGENPWVIDKQVSDYIGISPQDDTLSVVVTCKEAFAQQIELSAAVEDTPEISASIPIDYRQKFSHINLELWFGTGGALPNVTFSSENGVNQYAEMEFPFKGNVDLNSPSKYVLRIFGTQIYTIAMGEYSEGIVEVRVGSYLCSELDSIDAFYLKDYGIPIHTNDDAFFPYRAYTLLGLRGLVNLTTDIYISTLKKNYTGSSIVQYRVSGITVNGNVIPQVFEFSLGVSGLFVPGNVSLDPSKIEF